MAKQINDEDIIKYYQQSAKELPPKALDKVILSHSEKVLSKKSNLVPLKHKIKAATFPFAGLAAAIAAIVVLSPWQFKNNPILIEKSIQSNIEPTSKGLDLKPTAVEEQSGYTLQSSPLDDTLTLTPKSTHAPKMLSTEINTTLDKTKSAKKYKFIQQLRGY